MKKVIYSMLILAGTISCSKDKLNISSDKHIDVIAKLTDMADKTKAPITAWKANDKIGVYLCDGDDIDSPYLGKVSNKNVEFTYNTTKWTATQNPILNSNECTTYAYYPYSTTVSDPQAVDVDIASQTDYLYGKGANKASISNKSVTIPMKHALTQVVFKIRKDISYTDGVGNISNISLQNIGTGERLFSEGTMDIVSGNIMGTTKANVNYSIENVELTNEYCEMASMLIPTSFTANQVKVVLTIDNVDYEYSFNTPAAWEKGKRNIYSITLTNNSLIVGGEDGSEITIADWVDLTQSDISLIPSL